MEEALNCRTTASIWTKKKLVEKTSSAIQTFFSLNFFPSSIKIIIFLKPNVWFNAGPLFYNVVQYCLMLFSCSLFFNGVHRFTIPKSMYNVVNQCTLLYIPHEYCKLSFRLVCCFMRLYIYVHCCTSLYIVLQWCSFFDLTFKFWNKFWNFAKYQLIEETKCTLTS